MKIFRAESKEILDKVCSENERNVTYSSRMVPFKKRCGVKNKNIINMDNKCHCTEANNRGVGKNEIVIVKTLLYEILNECLLISILKLILLIYYH